MLNSNSGSTLHHFQDKAVNFADNFFKSFTHILIFHEQTHHSEILMESPLTGAC